MMLTSHTAPQQTSHCDKAISSKQQKVIMYEEMSGSTSTIESTSSSADHILVNDPNGLCLKATDPKMQSKAGVYTALVKLASLLDKKPKIIIETKTNRTHVKEYEGHTVAMKIPTKGGETDNPSTTATDAVDSQ